MLVSTPPNSLFSAGRTEQFHRRSASCSTTSVTPVRWACGALPSSWFIRFASIFFLRLFVILRPVCPPFAIARSVLYVVLLLPSDVLHILICVLLFIILFHPGLLVPAVHAGSLTTAAGSPSPTSTCWHVGETASSHMRLFSSTTLGCKLMGQVLLSLHPHGEMIKLTNDHQEPKGCTRTGHGDNT